MRALSVLMLVATSVFAADHQCPPAIDWAYDGARGPEHWSESWPACGTGKLQSPIDLPATAGAKNPAIQFHWTPFDLAVENTSHVIEVPAAHGGWISVNGHRYDLVQFHFHTPAEHLVGGAAAPLEVHFVHKDKAGKFAVVAIRASFGSDSAALKPITDALPVQSCQTRQLHKKFDPSAILPAERSYVRYDGSLTTPPCSEGVTFLVLKQEISLSPAQHKALSLNGPNARPVQPLNNRPVV